MPDLAAGGLGYETEAALLPRLVFQSKEKKHHLSHGILRLSDRKPGD